MKIEVKQWPPTALEQYAAISIAFQVKSVFEVGSSDEGFPLTERELDHPYTKDYDSIDGEGPLQWASRFDLSNWGVLIVEDNDQLLGGTIVAFDTSGLEMLEGRTDLAALWDIRVNPLARRNGVGSALLQAAEAWAEVRGCRQLKVETQNINVPACKFYARHGYEVTSVNPNAYPELPGEIQIMWTRYL